MPISLTLGARAAQAAIFTVDTSSDTNLTLCSGAITISAEYDTFQGAFGNTTTGANVTHNDNFVIPGN